MKHFADSLKLYALRDKNLISLSIRSSETHVLTFYIPQPQFDKILELYGAEGGYLEKPFLIHKKEGYLRFTHFGDFETNLRIDNEKWSALINDYRSKLDDTTDLITCVIP